MITPEDCLKMELDQVDHTNILPEEGPIPNDYLEYANSDLKEENVPRSWINSISNAKRALHLQVEVLIHALGYEFYSKSPCFPKRLEFCDKFGIVGTRIVEKLNKKRNLIEHEYYAPRNVDEVEDFIDIVTLFLESTAQLILKLPHEITLGTEHDLILYNHVKVSLEIAMGKVNVSGAEFMADINDVSGEAHVLKKQWEAKTGLVAEEEELRWSQSSTRLEIFQQLVRPHMREFKYTCYLVDGEEYFKWVRFILDCSNRF